MELKLAPLAALALALALPRAAHAEPEELEVTFDLAQYTHNGSFSFSQGCIANPPTGRNNFVHITVVWIEDDQGNYVTTLRRWGRTYVYNLKAWSVASDMSVDGITSATPTSNNNNPGQVFRSFSTGVHDISGLPDGNYRIRIESTQCELADEWRSGPTPLFGPEATFTFVKGRTSQTGVSLGSTAPFNSVTVNYTVPTGNAPPGAWAGVDQRLMPSVNPSEASTTLGGVADDENGTPTTSWLLVDTEPAGLTAQIADTSDLQTQVTFSTAGLYTFRLTATDGGGMSSSDEVEIWVNAYEVDASDDSEVARGAPNRMMGIIENSGPWVFSWGQCSSGENYSRGYYRFDMRGANAAITAARLRLPLGEATANASVHHDFFLLTDAEDDWNSGNNSSDWEATITFNNQSVPQGRSSNLDPQQLIGTFQHLPCAWRHGFGDPVPPLAPGIECPAWVEVDLDLTTVGAYDTNGEWSLFMEPRQGCNNGMGIGSRENLINPNIIVVEHWQSTANLGPTANAGEDRVVTDVLPSGSEMVTLDGSASTDDSGIVGYSWSEGGMVLGASAQPDGVTVPLSLGVHDIVLTVTDGPGLTAMDSVQVVVEDRFYPNHASGEAATIDGDSIGRVYDDLFVYTADPDGDWYALDVVDGTDVTVAVAAASGTLDVTLYQSDLTELASGTGSASGTSLNAGRYLVQVASAAPTTYDMTVTLTGPTVQITLDRMSAVESSGTITMAGTINVADAAMSAIDVTLASTQPSHLSFGTNPITIPMGQTSATFDIVLVDDPMGAPDENRYVDITATAAGFNRGSATFEILDDEASHTVNWDKAAESIDETRSPLVVLTAELSGTPSTPVTLPFTLGGTAEEGKDYTIMGSSTELRIAGTTRTSLLIALVDDEEVEDDETIVVTMGTPTGANPGSVIEFVLTIGDDDTGTGPPPIPPPPDEPTSGCNCRTERTVRTESAAASRSSGVSSLALLVVLVGLRRRRQRQ